MFNSFSFYYKCSTTTKKAEQESKREYVYKIQYILQIKNRGNGEEKCDSKVIVSSQYILTAIEKRQQQQQLILQRITTNE